MRETRQAQRTVARGAGGLILAAVACLGCLSAGCVDRRFVIVSNVPGAQVYIDNKAIGAAPAHAPFEYYGYYTIKLVHPGYETLEERVHVAAPWYAYPPFDFLAEVVWPFHVRDV
ncbi:MAG: PEGA domain-containing protein, partial [Gemmataceae bacterium]|nr:PEGA domain-containing protein [Gemmataceae bacterium]